MPSSRWKFMSVSLPLAALVLAASHPASAAATPAAATRDTAVFAGGCFWGVQAVFERIKGVVSSTSGYAGGRGNQPTYDDVSTGTTGYAESVRVIYDPAQISYRQLLQVFFAVALDPTERNRQGPDVGTQYRSALFVRNAVQRQAATAYIAELTRQHAFPRPIVTEVTDLNAFHEAEAYHQRFFDLHPDYPYIVINDKPKVAQLKSKFPGLFVAPSA
jgi:peptide-methionine (S)-S-oxide reductase